MTSNRQRGSALVFALAALILVAVTIATVSAEIHGRGVGVTIDERHVRLIALSDAAMAETLANLAEDRGFRGVARRRLAGGWVSSSVVAGGEHEVEIRAVGGRLGWHVAIVARVNLEHGPRVLEWHRSEIPDKVVEE